MPVSRHQWARMHPAGKRGAVWSVPDEAYTLAGVTEGSQQTYSLMQYVSNPGDESTAFVLVSQSKNGTPGSYGITVNSSTGVMTAPSSLTADSYAAVVSLNGASERTFGFAVQAASSFFGRVFYEDWSSGTIQSYWRQDGTRNRGNVVTVGADGTAPPDGQSYFWQSNANGTLSGSDPASFETLVFPVVPFTDEMLLRCWFRVDSNHGITDGSSPKFLRHYYYSGGEYLDVFLSLRANGAASNGVWAGGGFTTYWGSTPDSLGTPGAWHKIEMYWKRSTGAVKIWHDDVLKTDVSQANPGVLAPYGYNPAGLSRFFEVKDIYLRSNYADAHDAVNYIYYGPIEVYTDQGTGGTGSMNDGTAGA